MFQVKICGITSLADAEMVVAAGADAIGLNFYPGSPRHISLELAREIRRVVPPSVRTVGLFVNSPCDEIRRTHEQLGLDLVQLHGDEPPEFLTELDGLPVMRAFRVGQSGLSFVGQYLARCRDLGSLPALVLLDAFAPNQYGGTGQTGDWAAAKAYPPDEWHPPLVLAGGLTADNVAEAIVAVRPAAVDTASGVEQSPRRKSPEKVRRFVQAARMALAVG